MEMKKGFKMLSLILASLYLVYCMYHVTQVRTRPEPKPKRTDLDMKKIVLWTSYFGDSEWKEILGDQEPPVLSCAHPCSVHTDRRDPLLYDALVFHGRAAQYRPEQRRPSQVYIMYVLESPLHMESIPVKGDTFYNWTATYNRQSDVWVPYWDLRSIKYKSNYQNRIRPPRWTKTRKPFEAMVAWVVSNCNTPSKREEYVDALREHIKIDIFGGCGAPCSLRRPTLGKPTACNEAIAWYGSYKFYLSFENSACRDYITEKAEIPLRNYLVPIVYGGLESSDYLFKLPPKSYIDVRNFRSPKHLANYLLYLEKNNTAYMEYHAWRMEYELTSPDLLCEICKSLHDSSMRTPRNVDVGEFMNGQSNCDPFFYEKVNPYNSSNK